MRCQNLYNRGVIWLLRSPLHGLICDLITFTSALPTPSEHEKWRAWVLATAVGALVAWTLGMLPGTLMSAGSETGGAARPSQVQRLSTASPP